MSVQDHRLAPEPASVRAARHAVAAALASILDGETLERAVLCTSELVTNAVEHGTPPIDLRITCDEGSVRVGVHDASPRPPRLSDPTPTAIRGRGLLIVDRSTDRWGVTAEGAGKIVWFEIDR